MRYFFKVSTSTPSVFSIVYAHFAAKQKHCQTVYSLLFKRQRAIGFFRGELPTCYTLKLDCFILRSDF